MAFQFDILTYCLVLGSIISLAPIGMRLGVSGLATSSLVGVSLVALVAGMLANMAAAAIQPVILGAILLGFILGSWDLYRWISREGIKAVLWKARQVPILFVGLVVFLWLTNPADLILRTHDQSVQFFFDAHHSYYSWQSVEMLRAEYISRLKIGNLYPLVWSKYHFFSGATQAVAQGLIPRPGLGSYWVSVVCLVGLVFASFGELWMMLIRGRLALYKAAFVFAAWLLIGYTLLSPSLGWNLQTSGVFTVFAIPHLLVQLHRRNFLVAWVMAGIAAASVIRMAPMIVLAGVLSFVFVHVRILQIQCSFQMPLIQRGVSRFRQEAFRCARVFVQAIKLRPWLGVAIVCFVLYNAATLIFGNATSTPDPVMARGILSDGWHSPLATYRLSGQIMASTSSVKLANFNIDGNIRDNNLEWFHAKPIVLALLLFVAVIWFLAPARLLWRRLVQQARSSGGIIKWLLLVICLLTMLIMWLPNRMGTVGMLLFVSPYFFAAVAWMLRPGAMRTPAAAWASVTPLAMLLSAFAMQMTSLSFAVKAPVLFTTLDLTLWVLLGLVAFQNVRVGALAIGILAGVSVLSYQERFSDFYIYAPNRLNKWVDVTPLAQGQTLPEAFQTEPVDPASLEVDDHTFDAWTALLARRVASPGRPLFLTHRFVNPQPESEP